MAEARRPTNGTWAYFNVVETEPIDSPPTCRNCQAEIAGAFCSHCGQGVRIRQRTFWMLISDFLSHSFAFDSRFWRTLKPLLIRPGWLTDQNLRERWVDFLPPLRVYLVLSLMFFVVVSWNIELPELQTNSEEAAEQDNSTFHVNLGSLPESWPYAEEFNAAAQRRAEYFESLSPAERDRAFIREVVRSIPTFLLLAVPLFAFGLKILYFFTRTLFFNHFVFATHFYSFWLIILSVSVPINHPAVWAVGHGLVGPLYLFIALRRVYRQHWMLTLAKMILLGFWQILSAAVLLSGVVLYAFFQV